MKILIDAVYLNSDGGIELLDILIESTHKNFKNLDILYLLDSRNTLFNKKINYLTFVPRAFSKSFRKTWKAVATASLPKFSVSAT